MPRKHDGLAPRCHCFGADLLQNARFAGNEELPCSPGIVLPDAALDGVPFDHVSDRAVPPGAWLHFYVHDIRFLRFLESPGAWLRRIRRFAGVVGMDNSVYFDLPLCEQKHSVYLNRAADLWFARHGLRHVPNVSWGDWRSFSWCFDGIEPGKTVAVSSHGCIGTRADKARFLEGLAEAVAALRPPSVVFHGRLFPEAAELLSAAGIRIIPLRSRMERAFPGKEADHGQR